jgi:hypothetical protein
MTTDPLVRLQDLVRDAPRAMEAQRLGETLHKASQVVASVDADVLRLKILIELTDRLDLRKDGAIRANLEAIAEDFDDIAAILESNDFDGVDKTAAAARRNLHVTESIIHDRVKTYTARLAETLDTLGEVLARLPGTHELGRRMQEAAQSSRANASRISLASAPSFIDTLDAQSNALASERRAILKGGEVETFFQAIAENVATLRHLTPQVLQRLQELDALEAFAIEPASGRRID